jgi:hypothetical protein
VFTCQNNNQNPILSDYIYHQNEKSKPCEKDLPLLENDITTFELALKYGIHSRYQR